METKLLAVLVAAMAIAAGGLSAAVAQILQTTWALIPFTTQLPTGSVPLAGAQRPPSLMPPGGLPPAATPQFVLLTASLPPPAPPRAAAQRLGSKGGQAHAQI